MVDFDPRLHLNQIPTGPADDLNEALRHLSDKQPLKDGSMTGCTSYVQRKLQCSYNHAAAILEIMVERGIITDTDSRGARRFVPRVVAT